MTIDRYDEIYKAFRWYVPSVFNIAQVCCERWALNPSTTKSIAVAAHSAGEIPFNGIEELSYGELQRQADRLSLLLIAQGVRRGDKVAIILPQRLETAVSYMAVLQMGAVAVPLSQLFGEEALEYRLQDSETVLAIVDESTMETVNAVRGRCAALRCVLAVGEDKKAQKIADLSYFLMPNPSKPPVKQAGIATKNIAIETSQIRVKTKAEEAAVLIYTSGTTGPPKGALIPHRALIGNLTGFVASQNWFGFDPLQNSAPSHPPTDGGGLGWGRASIAGTARSAGEAKNAVFWSPADWAWTGGLMDALLPTLYFGKKIIAFKGRFSPQIAFEILQKHQVSHTFLFPTALKAMMKAYPEPRKLFQFKLEAIMSAGEAVGDAVYAYCEEQLGRRVNEMFGQTEINYIVGNCNRFWPSKPGSMGKGYPGHWVAVINEKSEICKSGEIGEVAVNHLDIHGESDPVFFLGYWKNTSATEKKTTVNAAGQRWCRTGDLAYADAGGYLWYQGRADDMFKAAGYRIGPSEVENCLVKHEAVLNAAVVPKPDKERGAVVKAYIVLAPHFVAARVGLARENGLKALEKYDQKLIADIQKHVKSRLAPYEYPKEIEFIEALPMTTTGKVQRRVLRLQEEERARGGEHTHLNPCHHNKIRA